MSRPPDGTEYNAIQVAAAGSMAAHERVPAFTVDSLMKIAEFPRIDLLKIDIEGAEVELFRGPITWLSRVNALAIEFHKDSRRVSDFDRVMCDAGFIVEEDRFLNTAVAFRSPGLRVC